MSENTLTIMKNSDGFSFNCFCLIMGRAYVNIRLYLYILQIN